MPRGYWDNQPLDRMAERAVETRRAEMSRRKANILEYSKGKLWIRFVRLKNCFGQLDGLSSGGWTFISEKCLHLYSHQKLPRLASFLMRNN